MRYARNALFYVLFLKTRSNTFLIMKIFCLMEQIAMPNKKKKKLDQLIKFCNCRKG